MQKQENNHSPEQQKQDDRALLSELKDSNQKLRLLLLTEKESHLATSRLMAMASHELRSPLSSIQLSAAMLERYDEKMGHSRRAFHLRQIRLAIDDLTGMLDDFLSLDEMANTQLKPTATKFDLKVFVGNLVTDMLGSAKPNQTISYHHQGETTEIQLDRQGLKHCLHNLVTNAIKYSGEGASIVISTHILRRSCVISVRDNGIGVPEECRQRIFEPFFRAGNTADIPGTGLGLAIVKYYVSLMNGKIEFESDKATGTVFSLNLPLIMEPNIVAGFDRYIK